MQMKKIFFALFMLSTINLLAQRAQNDDSKLASLQNEKDQAVLQEKIKAMENGTAEDLLVLVQYYKKDADKKNTVIKILNKKYPQSEQARMARITSFLDVEGGAEGIEAFLKSMTKEYPNINLDLEKNLVALAYAEVPNAAKVMEYINSMEDPVYQIMAIVMTLDLMAPINNALALDIATKELVKAKKIKGQITLTEPLKIDPETAYNDYINMYGKLLLKAGKNEEAYKYTKEAYNNIKNKDGELIENYAFLSSSFDGNYEEALPVLANAVKEGKNEKRYIDQLRKGYKKLNPEKDVDAYIASLQQGFIDKIKSHIEKLMVNEPAPDFYVTDVNGKKVTLADFKGKTIVLDFWATWCGPCVASFPAMQLAVNHYANDPDVKFLFIHTWENVKDPLTDAKQFLKKRNHDFNLYIDSRDKTTKHSPAADAFKIGGIPAKFIIDGNGRIRFKVEGFEGTDEAVAEEVVQMVEMARKGN